MKKILLILALTTLVSCGAGTAGSTKTDSTSTIVDSTAVDTTNAAVDTTNAAVDSIPQL